MKKILTYGLGGFVAFIALLFSVAALQPTEWTLERSILINAPRDQVWSIVSDLNRYHEWNPYARLDPDAKITVTGPAASLGSTYAWDGSQSGAGQMKTIKIQEGERIDFDLQFLRPMQVNNQASFIVDTQEGPTKMTWMMKGTHQGFTGLIGRTIHLFMDMDTIVGKDFETGLLLLKALTEET